MKRNVFIEEKTKFSIILKCSEQIERQANRGENLRIYDMSAALLI